MNIYSRAKWLQYLSKKNENQGNVLVAVLVVLIIVGVLVTMVFPKDNCCRENFNRSVRIITGGMNTEQTLEYLENGAFKDFKYESKNYEYSTRATKTAVFHYALAQKNTLEPFKKYFVSASEPLKSYVGAVFLVSSSRLEKKKLKKKIETLGIVCETSFPTSNIPANPTYKNGVITCGKNTKKVGYSSYVGALVEGELKTPAIGMTIVSIVCESNAPGAIKHVEPAYQNGEVACGSNTRSSYRHLDRYSYRHLY
ncbi:MULTISPECIES: type IV pilin-like G/H family protein [Cyanophyceae]|uniref:type IV pilin-like G/H family protein n=1 Tax=Cyanophyceae TaxID=3028117 RepID=UPI0016897084|nr:type IV pilin-like G/H family protein [Trichocoleus sp. FACHB-832]MBD1908348.1 hypothetical protein [Trichocoleus sp. FACHB-832]